LTFALWARWLCEEVLAIVVTQTKRISHAEEEAKVMKKTLCSVD
jgi:hypothetical protein